MAIAASAVWRIRAGGNAINGAAYDGTSYPGGTDYTQQDGPIVSFSGSTSAANSTTLIGSGTSFTSALVGNAVHISAGTNAITGYYFIVSVTDGTHLVLDRTPATAGALSGATCYIGGASDQLHTLLTQNNTTAGQYPVPGNTIYIRGAGSNNPTTADYTVPTGGYSLYGGSGPSGSTDLNLRIIGENGRPLIAGDFQYGSYPRWSYHIVNGICVKATGNSQSKYNGGMFGGDGGTYINCAFDQNGQDCAIFNYNSGLMLRDCEVWSSTTGTASTSNGAVFCNSLYAENCNFHDLITGALGIRDGSNIRGCVFANNALDDIGCSNYYGSWSIRDCTFVGGSGNGINLSGTVAGSSGTQFCTIENCLFANKTGTGKAGLMFSGGDASVVTTAYYVAVACNKYYNNTSHVSGATMDSRSQVLSSSPFNGASTEDYSLTSVLAGTGFPGVALPQSKSGMTATRSYFDPGALQRLEVASSGGAAGPTITFIS